MDEQIMEMYLFLIVMFIMSVWFGYAAFLAWFRPEKFVKLYKKSPFVIKTRSIEDWIESNSYLWMGRVFSTVSVIICGLMFVITVFSYVLNLIRH